MKNLYTNIEMILPNQEDYKLVIMDDVKALTYFDESKSAFYNDDFYLSTNNSIEDISISELIIKYQNDSDVFFYLSHQLIDIELSDLITNSQSKFLITFDKVEDYIGLFEKDKFKFKNLDTTTSNKIDPNKCLVGLVNYRSKYEEDIISEKAKNELNTYKYVPIQRDGEKVKDYKVRKKQPLRCHTAVKEGTLKRRRSKYNYNDDIRSQVARLRESGVSISEIVELLGCSRSSVYRWTKKYKTEPIIEQPKVAVPIGGKYSKMPNYDFFRNPKQHKKSIDMDELWGDRFNDAA